MDARNQRMQARLIDRKQVALKHEWKIIEAHREQSMILEAEKRKQAVIDAMLKMVPARYQQKTFADFLVENDGQQQVKNIVKRYAETFNDRLQEGSSLILQGAPGTGKTLLALIVYQYLANLDYRVEYQASLSFLRVLQEKQFESYQAGEAWLRHYKTLPFLIIDEVTEGCGKSAYPADWERHLLRVLIDARYQANRCTLIITNRSRKELVDRLGEPTIDRLSEKGITLAFNWGSYRKQLL